jgi:hypothetical protein
MSVCFSLMPKLTVFGPSGMALAVMIASAHFTWSWNCQRRGRFFREAGG